MNKKPTPVAYYVCTFSGKERSEGPSSFIDWTASSQGGPSLLLTARGTRGRVAPDFQQRKTSEKYH